MGGVPIVRLNRFCAGKIPAARTLARLAKVLDVPWPIAFWRAGYFREVLIGIDGVANRLDEMGDLNSDLHELTRASKSHLVFFALRVFPRRDVGTRFPMEADDYDASDFAARMIAEVSFDKVLARGIPRRLNPRLARAADALLDDVFSIGERRCLAGECVNAWADKYDYGLAHVARDYLCTNDSLRMFLRNDQQKGA